MNRAYYGMFYAVLALLQLIGRVPRKHQGAIGLYDTEFVQKELLAKETSQSLHRAFRARQEDDYHRLEPVALAEAAEHLAAAERFVDVVRDYLARAGPG